LAFLTVHTLGHAAAIRNKRNGFVSLASFPQPAGLCDPAIRNKRNGFVSSPPIVSFQPAEIAGYPQ
jgi:hypothetical protein